MRIINIQSDIREWLEQFGSRPDLANVVSRLQSLDMETVTVDQANAVANNRFSRHACHECGHVVDMLVEIGEERDYESSTAVICLSCLKQAVALVEPTHVLR